MGRFVTWLIYGTVTHLSMHCRAEAAEVASRQGRSSCSTSLLRDGGRSESTSKFWGHQEISGRRGVCFQVVTHWSKHPGGQEGGTKSSFLLCIMGQWRRV